MYLFDLFTTNFSYRRCTALSVLVAFFLTSLQPLPHAQAQNVAPVLNLPQPGTMIQPTAAFNPPILKGITIYPEDPFKFEFIFDQGDQSLDDTEIEAESKKLIKYFLASLTTPEEQLWVNLSPYEQDRIIADEFGQTEMGRDLLAQDYILKQLTASLIYPEEELGNQFWDEIYTKAYEQYGTTEIPINTFNKVWIVPEDPVVHQNGNEAYVVTNKLKVLLEQDYMATHEQAAEHSIGTNVQVEPQDEMASQVIREVILPAIEHEVNHGQHFAPLRQIQNSLILAIWYKKTLKQSLLSQSFVDQNKTQGIEVEDKAIHEKIYEQYLAAFKQGVYNYIKEDYDFITQEVIPKKYFSGGYSTRSENGPLADRIAVGEGKGGDSGTHRIEARFDSASGQQRSLRTFRFHEPIWDKFKNKLDALEETFPGVSTMVRSYGLGHVDQDRNIYFIDEQFGGEGRATSLAIWNAARESLNEYYGWEPESEQYLTLVAEVKNVVRYHEELHNAYFDEEIQIRLEGIRDLLEIAVFDAKLTLEHPFIQAMRAVYGKPHVQVEQPSENDDDLIQWYLEEFLTLSVQEAELFSDRDFTRVYKRLIEVYQDLDEFTDAIQMMVYEFHHTISRVMEEDMGGPRLNIIVTDFAKSHFVLDEQWNIQKYDYEEALEQEQIDWLAEIMNQARSQFLDVELNNVFLLVDEVEDLFDVDAQAKEINLGRSAFQSREILEYSIYVALLQLQ